MIAYCDLSKVKEHCSELTFDEWQKKEKYKGYCVCPEHCVKYQLDYQAHLFFHCCRCSKDVPAEVRLYFEQGQITIEP